MPVICIYYSFASFQWFSVRRSFFLFASVLYIVAMINPLMRTREREIEKEDESMVFNSPSVLSDYFIFTECLHFTSLHRTHTLSDTIHSVIPFLLSSGWHVACSVSWLNHTHIRPCWLSPLHPTHSLRQPPYRYLVNDVWCYVSSNVQ